MLEEYTELCLRKHWEEEDEALTSMTCRNLSSEGG